MSTGQETPSRPFLRQIFLEEIQGGGRIFLRQIFMYWYCFFLVFGALLNIFDLAFPVEDICILQSS
jgi:hypothetical protein